MDLENMLLSMPTRTNSMTKRGMLGQRLKGGRDGRGSTANSAPAFKLGANDRRDELRRVVSVRVVRGHYVALEQHNRCGN